MTAASFGAPSSPELLFGPIDLICSLDRIMDFDRHAQNAKIPSGARSHRKFRERDDVSVSGSKILSLKP